MKNFIAPAGTLALSCAILSVSQAAPANAPSAAIRFADLDLNRPVGLEQLYNRVSLASRTLCWWADPGVSVVRIEADKVYKKCLHDITMQAVGSINRPAFTALVTSKMTGTDTAIAVAAR